MQLLENKIIEWLTNILLLLTMLVHSGESTSPQPSG